MSSTSEVANPQALRPNPWNTNHCSAEAMQKLTESLRQHGWVKPIVVRELPSGDLEILGGQHRVEAAIALGMTEVPVFNLGPIDDDRAKRVGLIDNTRYGQDDALELADLIAELGGQSVLTDFLPLSDSELASFGADIDLETLEVAGEERTEEVSVEKEKRPAKTHQMMRFKVPVEDAEMVSAVFADVMHEQGFTEADSLTNAGDALVYVARSHRDGVL